MAALGIVGMLGVFALVFNLQLVLLRARQALGCIVQGRAPRPVPGRRTERMREKSTAEGLGPLGKAHARRA